MNLLHRVTAEAFWLTGLLIGAGTLLSFTLLSSEPKSPRMFEARTGSMSIVVSGAFRSVRTTVLAPVQGTLTKVTTQSNATVAAGDLLGVLTTTRPGSRTPGEVRTSTSEIRSPTSGLVTSVFACAGDAINQAGPLFELSSPALVVSLPVGNAKYIEDGMLVRQLHSSKSTQLLRVERLEPVTDSPERAADFVLRPTGSGNDTASSDVPVEFLFQERLVVPRDHVGQEIERLGQKADSWSAYVVTSANHSGKPKPVEVTLGLKTATHVEILTGLPSGACVVAWHDRKADLNHSAVQSQCPSLKSQARGGI